MKKLRLGLEELATVREQFTPLISLSPGASVGVIERAAACAMYGQTETEIGPSCVSSRSLQRHSSGFVRAERAYSRSRNGIPKQLGQPELLISRG